MKTVWIKDFFSRAKCGDAEPGDFVIGLPYQSLGDYIEVILVKKRGLVETNVYPMFKVFEFVLTIRHSLVHDNGTEEVVFQTGTKRTAEVMMGLVEGTLYRFSTKLKQVRTRKGWNTFFALCVNRPEPKYEIRNSEA